MTSACLAVVEADEAMLQVFALQWRAIDLRAKQLQNQCRQVELDEELDREERDLIYEHETLLRMKEKQLTQQRYEDQFKLSTATEAVRKLQQQTEQLHQRRESLLPLHELSPPSPPAPTTTTARAIKPTSKVAKRGNVPSALSKPSSGMSSSAVNASMPAKKATKSVAFSPSTGTHTSRSRRLEDSFNDEDDSSSAVTASAARAPTKPSAADELMQMLAQDKASDSEGEVPSLADLLFSPDAPRPSSPRRAGTTSSNSTPSKLTPSKLARSVMKKALAAPLEFDFTRKAALAKAKAEREKQQQRAAPSDSDASDDDPAEAETPSKKALKRRKDLGISFTDRSASATATSKAKDKATSASAAAVVVRATSSAASGSKSLMEMVGAASLVTAKVPKSTDTSAAKTQTSAKASTAAAIAVKLKTKTKAKKNKSDDASEPESEDFPGLEAANITKRAKPKAKAKTGLDADFSSAPTNAKDKPKTKKASAADVVSAMPQLQDIATPKVAGKKTKTLLFKQTTTASALAAKRTEFQQTLADTGATASSNDQSDGGDSDDASGVETPRKAPVMKRKRTQDAPAAPVATTAYMQSPSVAAMFAMRASKSPIGIRYVPKALKSPQITRKRQRTGDDAARSDIAAAAAPSGASAGPTTRAQRRPVRDTRSTTGGGLSASGVGASGLWGNSNASFFDAFVNGGAPRLKRSVVP